MVGLSRFQAHFRTSRRTIRRARRLILSHDDPCTDRNPMNKNRQLFLASFFTLIAAGTLFGIRNTILDVWGTQFHFTKGDLGVITGFGLTGFGFTIIACSLIADRVAYKPLMMLAFMLHASSSLVMM